MKILLEEGTDQMTIRGSTVGYVLQFGILGPEDLLASRRESWSFYFVLSDKPDKKDNPEMIHAGIQTPVYYSPTLRTEYLRLIIEAHYKELKIEVEWNSSSESGPKKLIGLHMPPLSEFWEEEERKSLFDNLGATLVASLYRDGDTYKPEREMIHDGEVKAPPHPPR